MSLFNIFKRKQTKEIIGKPIDIEQVEAKKARISKLNVVIDPPKETALQKHRRKQKSRFSEVKKKKYKRARNQGQSIRKSMIEAGYAESTAIGVNGAASFVKLCEKERSAALDRNKWSKEHFLTKREGIIDKCEKRNDFTNVIRAVEGQERLAGADKSLDQAQINVYNLPQNEEGLTNSILNRLKGLAKK